MNSLHMGCVSWTARFFPNGRVTRDGWRRAVLAARQEIEPIARAYKREGWQDVIGSSGTIRSVREIVRESGWADAGITDEGLKKLRRALLDAGALDQLELPGLSSDRRPVLPGGAAILKALFDSLELAGMRTSDYALREGILYDLLGRIEDQDVRERTVENFALRYHVDVEQAARVEVTALDLFRDVADAWSLDPSRGTRYLRWATRLIEVGLAIAYSGYQKHGAYVVANSTMPGFARESRLLLAALVRNHRRKLDTTAFLGLPPYYRGLGLRLCVLLRLAVCLNRGRGATRLPEIRAEASGDELHLRLPPGWLDEHPLTSADLAAESAAFAACGIRFTAS
jgi:exopolyphosphatase/guanosine-5'-triphosphate,3'-diphosphate pyrophosphatase